MISAVNFRFVLILLSSLLLGGCLPQSQNKSSDTIKEIQGEIFGSYFIVKYYGELDQQEFKKELDKFFKEFNDEFSTYQKNSVITSLNNLPVNQKMKVSRRFIEMLKMAKSFHEQTNGAFDPTLGPVIRAWGFGGAEVKVTPTDAQIKAAMGKVGFQHLQWDDVKLEVWKNREISLDVNAFAPGWAADLIGKLLNDHAVSSYMVDISGEILFKGLKVNKKKWITGIEKPSEKPGQAVHLAFEITDSAIATSGDYRQYFNDKGVKKSHIISPKTGRPVDHSISSATVLAPNAALADAWSTAIMVLGESGIDLAEKSGIKVYLLKAHKPSEFSPIISPSMQTYLDAHRL